MAQVVECEDKPNNVTKYCHEDKNDTPKRATRSKRLTKPKKELESSPSSKKQSKEEKPPLEGATDNLTKKRVLWSCIDKGLFFDALLEYGKDFDAIQNFMYQKQKKRGDTEYNLKSKDQIRHFYYRTWHKISPFINQTTSDETKKQTIELQGVLCYGEIRKKVVAKFDEKLGHKLNELVHKGSAIVKLKGKKLVLRAPSCKAKKLLQQQAESICQGKVLVPEKISVELVPQNNKSWSFVQSLSQNPRVQIITRTGHTVASIIAFLQQKWSQERSESESKTKLRVHLPPNTRIIPSSSDTQSKFKLKSDAQHGAEMNPAENKPSKCSESLPTNSEFSSPDQTSISSSRQVAQQPEGNEEEDDDNDDGIHMEADDEDEGERKSKPLNAEPDKREENKDKYGGMELDEASRRLVMEGLDETTGSHMTISRLQVLLGCPEVIRMEYDWLDPSKQLPADERHPGETEGLRGCGTQTEPSLGPPQFASCLNSRIRRLLEIACTEYGSVSDQKNKDPKVKESKGPPSLAVSSSNEVFRVPDSIPPRASQASRNAEKRIMDHDLLQQMPIFQKKSEMFISRRSRRKTLQKVPLPPLVNTQRVLAPKINVPIGHHEAQVPIGCSSLMGFSSLSNLIALNASSSSLPPATHVQISISSSSMSSSPSVTLSKPSLITMEPSELKPSVRRIIPITLNKMANHEAAVKIATTTCQPSTISKVITGTDVFLADKIFEDSTSQDVSTNHKMVDCAGSNHVIKNNESTTLHKQTSIEEHWLHNEELSLTSFLHDVSSNPSAPNGVNNLLQHIFMSESSRDSNLLTKFDVDLQCLMNESSLDYASRFADIAAQLSTSSVSSAGLFQTPSVSSSSLTSTTVTTIPSTCQSSFVTSKLIT